MNRREALATLVAMPEITRISRAAVKPTDVIVVETDHALSMEAIRNITSSLQQIWPDQRIVVMSEGLKLKVVEHVG